MGHQPIDASGMRTRLRERYEEIGARNLKLEREARRARRRTMVQGALIAWFFCVLGLVGVGASLNTGNAELGWIWFWGGLTVGNGGILAALMWTFARLRARGDE